MATGPVGNEAKQRLQRLLTQGLTRQEWPVSRPPINIIYPAMVCLGASASLLHKRVVYMVKYLKLLMLSK